MPGSRSPPWATSTATGPPDFAVGAPGTDGTLPAVKGGKVYVIFGSKCSTATAPDGSCQSATTNANLDLGNLGTRGYVINGPALPAVTGDVRVFDLPELGSPCYCRWSGMSQSRPQGGGHREKRIQGT